MNTGTTGGDGHGLSLVRMHWYDMETRLPPTTVQASYEEGSRTCRLMQIDARIGVD